MGIDDQFHITTGEELNTPLGIYLSLAAGICRGTHAILWQILSAKYKRPLMKQFGTETVFSVLWTIIIALILDITNVNKIAREFWGFYNTPAVAWTTVVFGFGSSVFNTLATLLSNVVCAVFRLIIVNSSCVFEWIAETLLKWNAFTIEALIGNIIVIFG